MAEGGDTGREVRAEGASSLGGEGRGSELSELLGYLKSSPIGESGQRDGPPSSPSSLSSLGMDRSGVESTRGDPTGFGVGRASLGLAEHDAGCRFIGR